MTPQPLSVRDKHMEVALKIYKWFGREPFEPEGLADILARHYSAPSEPTRSGALSEPGWYECRYLGHVPNRRGVLFWNGEFLFACSDGTFQRSTEDFTDFLGPLVPACRDEEVESLRESAKMLLRQADYVVGLIMEVGISTSWDDGDETDRVYAYHEIEPLEAAANVMRSILSPPLSTPDERSVENG